jgi:Cdc6-like AAA superfamily ATPase
MKTELEKLKAEIENNYKADITAVNQLIGMYGQKRTETSKALAGFVAASRPAKGTYEVVEGLIKNYVGSFGIDEIYFKLREARGKMPSTEAPRIISQVINKLKQRGEIEVVEAGRGRRSGIYKYKKP